MSRCGSCPIGLPECGGVHDPSLCRATPHKRLVDRSRFESSRIHGWPRAAPAAPPARVLPDPSRSVLLHCYVCSWQGYGRIARALGQGLEAIGVPARYLAVPLQGLDVLLPVDDWSRSRLVTEAEAARWGASVALQVPETRARPGQRKAAFTMTESTGLRPDQLAGARDSGLVIVPCRANADWFRAAGVTAPVAVVPIGLTDPEAFACREGRALSGPTRFGMAGRQAHGTRRKNLQGAIDAFRAAFDAGQDARLEILSRDPLPLDGRDDPRITIHREAMDSAGLGDWYRRFDAFLSLTRGEGWGMHQAESAACGVPQIAPLWGGLADHLDGGENYPVGFTLAPTREPAWAGDWCEPDHDSAVEQLRAVHADRGEAMRRGLLASNRAHSFTWEASARALAAALRSAGMLEGVEAAAP